MTKHEVPAHGSNAPQPVRTARLARPSGGARPARGAQARIRPEVRTGRLSPSGSTACVPRCSRSPGGHPIPVVSGLVSNRGWMAEAMAVEPHELLARFQEAASYPMPWREVEHRRRCRRWCIARVDLARLLPLPTHNEHDGGPYITAGLMIARNPQTGKQNVSIHRCQVTGPQSARRPDSAAPHPRVLRRWPRRRAAARCRDRHRRRPADAAGLAGDRADRS